MEETSKLSFMGDYYRKRAAGMAKQLKKRRLGSSIRETLNVKRKALSDLANNEDWLDGKIKPKD
jgi:hypothetical protein